MQRSVDHVIAVTKESVKTITYESLNSIIRVINGLSALLLTVLPGKSSILEGIHGWELRPRVHGPRLPRWMENGVSSFNQFIHELSVNSDESSCKGDLSEDEDSDEHSSPPPLSQVARVSRTTSFSRLNRRRTCWSTLMFSWLLLPAKLFLSILLLLLSHFSSSQGSITSPAAENEISSLANSLSKVNALKDHIIHRATDRRRGVVEDLQLATEIFIESSFDGVHKAVGYILSPFESISLFLRWSFPSQGYSTDDAYGSSLDATVPTSFLAEHDSTPSYQHMILNTDSRTCQDVITELGYPYEAIRVVTDDGYILPLERIPKRDARNVVYLQHGILDSSMGWVSNGVVGSPAFAAFDQGCDVFLGNFRGLVSREHINQNISSQQYVPAFSDRFTPTHRWNLTCSWSIQAELIITS
ncbi:hypothetical protein SAY86_005023 [Trapa natans]|uniref:Partial AB-hydrolase lipase domain-containing protein n=1 Tax=Trapa natans TaxID=22666 RepID=A0AAN7L762_TRANT|nr:hypothetical protein SAY86_005023 [Trapa natans]